MERKITEYLKKWKNDSNRKTYIIFLERYNMELSKITFEDVSLEFLEYKKIK